MKWLSRMLTERDNQTPCTVRIGAFFGSFTGIGLAIYDVVGHGHEFNMLAFGTGLGVLLGAAKTALSWKPESEN